MISPADASHPERYRNSRVVPPGFHVVQEPMWGVVAGGIGAFAIGYLPFAIFGPLGGRPWLAIPFVGPIVNYRPSGGWFGGTIDFLHIVGIVIDVAVQVAGIGAIIGGAVARKRWLERDAQQPRISFAPGAAGSPLGASIVGTF